MTSNYHHGDLKNALIQAGVEILTAEGIHALTLRKVAKRVGVSHAAPYAHFPDKQSLIAAIAAEGYKKLTEQIIQIIEQYADDPLAQLLNAAWAYIEFAKAEPAYFKLSFSGIVEQEENYPEYVEQTKKAFGLVVKIIQACQQDHILKNANVELMSIAIWGSIHGLVELTLGNQLPGAVLDKFSLREMLIFNLQQYLDIPIDASYWAS